MCDVVADGGVAEDGAAGNRCKPVPVEMTMHRGKQLWNLLGRARRNKPATTDVVTPEAGEPLDEVHGPSDDSPSEPARRITAEQAEQILAEADQTQQRRREWAEEIAETQATTDALDDHLAALHRQGLRRRR